MPTFVDSFRGEISMPNTGRKKSGFALGAGIAAVLSILILAAGAAPAAGDTPARQRPRVGLVLSGGGARGMAHIGVLKVLEEMRVPIDCIAGVSAGAIVGGLYAAGLSTAELEKLVTSLSWNEAFMDTPPVDEMAFRRKEDSQKYKIDFDLGHRDGRFTVPRGLIQGQNLNLLLKQQLTRVLEIRDFDRLSIPFRAVASDIVTGEEVVLGSGDLAEAIRASLSIPGVFAPVERDGRFLVDGGVANNLPVNVARQMGADVVIAVDISTPLRPKEVLQSSAAISAQILTILLQRNVQAQLKTLGPADILVRPDMGSVKSMDFYGSAQAVRIGQMAAGEERARLSALSMTEGEYGEHLARRAQPSPDPLRIDYVKVENRSKMSPKVIESQIETKAGGPLDMAVVKKDIERIYGLGTFERVDFRLEKREKERGLVFEPVEKSWGPTYIKFGLGLADNFKGESTYSLSASVTQTEMNALGGEWRTEAQIGEEPRLFTEFYQPIDYSTRYFVAPQAEYRERNVNVFDAEGNTVARYRIRHLVGGLDVGRQFGNWGELRAGVRRAYGTSRVNVGDPSLETGSFNRGGLAASFRYNTLDNFNFPSRGATSDLSIDSNLVELGSENRAHGMTVSAQKVFTWGDYSLIPGIMYSGFFNTDATIEDSYSLGGFFNLSGYLPEELSGQHVGLGRVIFYRKIGSLGLGHYRSQLYFGGSAEAGNAWREREDISTSALIYGGSIFLGAETFLGPAYLAYGIAEGGHHTLGLYIGQRF